jgi:hypothetical protein
MNKTITVFTDLETDDLVCLRLLEQMNPQNIILVVGDGDLNKKFAVANKLKQTSSNPNPNLYTILTGIETDRGYNTSLPFSSEKFTFDSFNCQTACSISDIVICIKPPRELMLIDDNIVFNGECWLTGSFNLRSVWKSVVSQEFPIEKLQKLFPKKLVLIESFTAIGEDNVVNHIDFKDPFLNQVRKDWNEYELKEAQEQIFHYAKGFVNQMENESKQFNECFKNIDGLKRNLKRLSQIEKEPKQFLLADQLIPILLEHPEWLTNVNFYGYGGKTYPLFKETEEGHLYISKNFQEILRKTVVEKCEKL